MRPRTLTKQLARLLRAIGLPDAEVSVLFTGDRAIQSLNRRYRGLDRATDVLSFSLQEGPAPHLRTNHLGDIVIAVPTALRQARQEGHSLRQEIERLLVHGLLHLAGYDHEQGVAEATRMRRRERTLTRLLAAKNR